MSLLEKIENPDDLKKLKESQLPQLCEELRDFLLNTLSQTGGHLASNLGSVELTVALHYVYDSPTDKFCWDVGHQTYVHKILTGRKNELHTVRTDGGLSGFPKIQESDHDHYNTGHAGTSVSQGLGEAVARDTKLRLGLIDEPYNVVSIIGDASIVSGMSFEALNHGGHIKSPFLVLLNDNDMSISPNVGALNYTMNNFTTLKLYQRWKTRIFELIRWLPLVGPIFERYLKKFKNTMKFFFTEHRFFQELGFEYLGPLDGHDVKKLVKMFRHLDQLEKPTVFHIVTCKGKGYRPAEKDPVKYHGVKPFETATGKMSSSQDKWGFSKFVGASLTEIANEDGTIAAITPAMKEGSGLVKFAEKHPDKFYDAGMAEQHATTFAGSLAKAGLKPYLCIYSTFLQRGYDQFVQDIALMNLPVRMVLDRAGCVGGDGETHQGLYDISYMACIPNVKILSASNALELMQILDFMKTYNEGPISVRFPKKDFKKSSFEEWLSVRKKKAKFNPFQAKLIAKGKTAVVFTEGTMLSNGLQAREILEPQGISLEIVSLRSIRPFDDRTISKTLAKHSHVFTLENHVLAGGVGHLFQNQFAAKLEGKHLQSFGYPVESIDHGSIAGVEKKYKLDAISLSRQIKAVVNKGLKKKSSKSQKASA